MSTDSGSNIVKASGKVFVGNGITTKYSSYNLGDVTLTGSAGQVRFNFINAMENDLFTVVLTIRMNEQSYPNTWFQFTGSYEFGFTTHFFVSIYNMWNYGLADLTQKGGVINLIVI